MNFGPVVPSFGPTPARIALVAEAPGQEESDALRPLVGQSGRELRRMLATIGVSLDDCYRANVFSCQPASNHLPLFAVPDPSPASRSLGPLCRNPLAWVGNEWLPELDRLRAELLACNPNIVIALGNVACWALLGRQGITELRGTVHVSEFLPTRQLKVLPTYHPAAVLRQWEWRGIVMADLEKAHVEATSPDFHYDNTELWLAPTLHDLDKFASLHMAHASRCATDVETKRGQITCVSFAPTQAISLTVPFWIEGPRPHYWSVPDELAAWRWVRHWIEKPDLVKVTQNGLYDIQYFIRHGMKPRGFAEDTMLQHHSLYSEMRKSLGFLGSIYTQHPAWKTMRRFSRTTKVEQLKRDD